MTATSSNDRHEAARKALARWDGGSLSAASSVAEALRALIEAPATAETAEQLAEAAYAAAHDCSVDDLEPHDREAAHERVLPFIRAAQAAPTFKPEGVPDAYRNWWREVQDEPTNKDWLFAVEFVGPGQWSHLIGVSRDQARRILAMLSSEDADQ